jgi:hypothetical protein
MNSLVKVLLISMEITVRRLENNYLQIAWFEMEGRGVIMFYDGYSYFVKHNCYKFVLSGLRTILIFDILKLFK